MIEKNTSTKPIPKKLPTSSQMSQLGTQTQIEENSGIVSGEPNMAATEVDTMHDFQPQMSSLVHVAYTGTGTLSLSKDSSHPELKPMGAFNMPSGEVGRSQPRTPATHNRNILALENNLPKDQPAIPIYHCCNHSGLSDHLQSFLKTH